MGLNLPGVGGGFLAAAGAVGGLGQGMTQVGQEQQKVNLAQKMNDLQKTREEAITRLQGQQQSQLEEQRAGHEETRVHEEIAGHAAVSQNEIAHKEAESEKQRTFTGGEDTAKRASQEKIAAGHDVARVTAAKAHAPGAKAPPKEWTPRTLTLQGSFDPVSHAMIPGRGMSVMTHRDGSTWVQVGDRLLPYDATSPDGLGIKPESIGRAPAGAVQALVTNPLGSTPSGMPLKDSFANRYHYLPLQYMNAATAARDAASKGAGGAGGGVGDEATAPENEDASESTPGPGETPPPTE